MCEKHTFLVPEYFPEFRCKISACRHACCIGWPISISLKDYFHLLGVPCSAELRRRLDTSLHLCEHPTEDRYAQICLRYDGDCGMRLPDGRCALHAELGEEALSAVCRLYPRGIRVHGGLECSCANSCEATIECFLDRPEPLRFLKVELPLVPPEPIPRENTFASAGQEQRIRLYYIHILQDRRQPMPARIMALGEAMRKMHDALTAKDDAQVEAFLTGELPLFDESAMPVSHDDLVRGLEVMESMMERIDEHSPRLLEFGQSALAWFRGGDNPMEQYRLAHQALEKTLPNYESVYEHMLVNHIFFEQFPYQDRPMGFRDEFIGLCAGAAFLRFLTMGWLAEHPTREAFVDVCAAAFRVVDHTDFDRYAAFLLKESNFYELSQLHDLVKL